MQQDNSNNFKKEIFKTSDLASLIDELDDVEVKGKDEVWNEIQASMVKRKHSSLNRYVQVAAVVILLVLSPLSICFFTSRNDLITVKTAQLLTPKEIVLPDSTHVFIASNSVFSYPKHFAENERRVKLNGLAYFSVTKDKARPFIIKSPKSMVKVLGTSFSFRAYDGSKSEEVFLEEGSVKFYNKKENVLLKPGEIAKVNTGTQHFYKRVNLDKNIDAWKTRVLQFDNAPLDYVFEKLEDYYGKHFIVKNREVLDYRFNGHFDDASLDEMLEVLSYTLELDCSMNGNNILLTENN